MGSISVHRVQHKLNLLHGTIFPLLGDKGSRIDGEEVIIIQFYWYFSKFGCESDRGNFKG